MCFLRMWKQEQYSIKMEQKPQVEARFESKFLIPHLKTNLLPEKGKIVLDVLFQALSKEVSYEKNNNGIERI